jgi:peptidoglycan/LPS O-acetylase OafA/YrhL
LTPTYYAVELSNQPKKLFLSSEILMKLDIKSVDAPFGYLPTLDGWRAVAVSLVLFSHGSYSLSAFTGGASDIIGDNFPNFGPFGVHIFFGLSGFLICSRLIDESNENALTGGINLQKFYLRRFFRIIPPLFVMMLFILGPATLGEFNISFSQWIAGLFFAANYWRVSGGRWYLGHLWSLAVEEHFYVIFPGVLRLAGVRRGLFISIASACTIAVWRAVLFKIENSAGTMNAAYFWCRTDVQADWLLWGCVIAFIYNSPDARTVLKTLLKPVVWWGLVIVSVIASISAVPVHFNIGWKRAMAMYAIQAAVVPLILVGTVLRPQGGPARFLECYPLRWFGKLSYSVYLWQQLFLVRPEDTAKTLGWLQQFPVNLGATMVMAMASYYLIEKPAVKLGHRIASVTAKPKLTPQCCETV